MQRLRPDPMALAARTGRLSLRTMTGFAMLGKRAPGPTLAMRFCWKEAESGMETPSTKMPVVPQAVVLMEWTTAAPPRLRTSSPAWMASGPDVPPIMAESARARGLGKS